MNISVTFQLGLDTWVSNSAGSFNREIQYKIRNKRMYPPTPSFSPPSSQKKNKKKLPEFKHLNIYMDLFNKVNLQQGKELKSRSINVTG